MTDKELSTLSWQEEAMHQNALLHQALSRAARLAALLREARIDLEHYITHEYPKHLHPYYERQWNRDMELCRRIDAELKGEQQ